MRTTHFAPSIALALLVMASHATLAQDETAPAKGEAVVVVQGEAAVVQDEMARQRLTPADTSSFRATLHSFIDACNDVYDLAGRKLVRLCFLVLSASASSDST